MQKAVHASSAIPECLSPCKLFEQDAGGRRVVNNVAVDVARQRGADIVIAVDVGANVVNYEIGNLFDISLQAVNIMDNEIARFKIKGAGYYNCPCCRQCGDA